MQYKDLEAAFASTRSVLANITADQYPLPTPCAAWDVQELINHVVSGAHWFAATAMAGEGDPAKYPPHVIGDDIPAAYDEGTKACLAAFADPAVLGKTITL